MAYCMKGRELLLDLQRSDWLPAYDEDGVRQVLGEANEIVNQLNQHLHGRSSKTLPNEEKPYTIYLQTCFNRDIRYSHAYFHHRIEKIRGLRWESGPVLPDHLHKDTLSTAENDYFNEYVSFVSISRLY